MGRHLRLRDLRPLGLGHVRFEDPGFRDLEQAIHELRLGADHLDLDYFQSPGELVERDDRGDRNEDTERRLH
jgi:hypothetical protein